MTLVLHIGDRAPQFCHALASANNAVQHDPKATAFGTGRHAIDHSKGRRQNSCWSDSALMVLRTTSTNVAGSSQSTLPIELRAIAAPSARLMRWLGATGAALTSWIRGWV